MSGAVQMCAAAWLPVEALHFNGAQNTFAVHFLANARFFQLLRGAEAIDPGLTQPDNAFQRQMTELVETIKALPKQDGVDEIRIPSERSFQERVRRRVEGIVVEKKIVEMLEEL